MSWAKHLTKLAMAISAGGLLVIITSCGPGWDTNSPLVQEMSGMRKLVVKLRDYSETNSAALDWAKVGTNVKALVDAGALSPADADYIRLHKLQFCGFDPARITGNVAVFKMVFTNSSKPARRIIGHSDGSVTVRNLEASE